MHYYEAVFVKKLLLISRSVLIISHEKFFTCMCTLHTHICKYCWRKMFNRSWHRHFVVQ